ncbi:MAG: aminotransferase class I/II-fold pyridoxal phosphate-dependent enzyme [Salinivirgaceae bacterium]|jgi:methionine aminotransferase|nr:aminotransferase class I/II-fold pyridoxal phosphate-dependent enzyme [Salinivirgaceae bacterium]
MKTLQDLSRLSRFAIANRSIWVINSPHNPTGITLSAWDIQKLKKVVNGTDILILSDEVYEHIIFDNMEHESLAKYNELKDRTIIVNSFGKTFHTCGWRLGYVLAAKHLMTEFRKVHEFSTYTANTPIQYAFAEYINDNYSYTNLSAFYEKKRDFLCQLLKESKFTLKPTKGTCFQCIDYSQISDEGDFEFASRLIRDYKIAAIPLSYFYKTKTDNKLLRLCFAKNDDTLKGAAENLLKVGNS